MRKRAEGALDRACRESWTPEEAAGAHGAMDCEEFYGKVDPRATKLTCSTYSRRGEVWSSQVKSRQGVLEDEIYIYELWGSGQSHEGIHGVVCS